MPPEGPKKEQRIGILSAIMMVALAFLFDVFQFLATFLNIVPGLGVALCLYISMLSFSAFFVWFALKGVDYLDRNGAVKLIVIIATTVTELIPLVDALPAITLGVLSLIIITRAEDSGIDLNAVRKARFAKMTAEQQVASRARAQTRIDRDQKPSVRRGQLGDQDQSYESQRIEKERQKRGAVGYSAPTLKDFERDTRDENYASDEYKEGL